MKTQFEEGQLKAIEVMIIDVKGRIGVYKEIGSVNDTDSIEKSKKRSERVSELKSILSRLLRYQKVVNKR